MNGHHHPPGHEDELSESVEKLTKSILVLAKTIDSLGSSKPKQTVVFGYAIDLPKLKKVKRMPLEITITNEQQVDVHLKPVTATGKPAKLDGVPEWVVNSGPAKVTPDTSGLNATLVSDDNDLSDTIVQINADADLGSGVETVSDTITLHTAHANATSLGLSADQPVAKP